MRRWRWTLVLLASCGGGQVAGGDAGPEATVFPDLLVDVSEVIDITVEVESGETADVPRIPCAVDDDCKALIPAGTCLTAACDGGHCTVGARPDGEPCDDLDACTTGETCLDGFCTGGAAVSCDDGDPCTADRCNALTGCTNGEAMLPCDDGDACTVGDMCGQGACQPGPAADCDDHNPCTDDSCDPKSGCVHAANAGFCDDGDPCTKGESCLGGTCRPAAVMDCDDGDPCTDDSCDQSAGCVHLANAAPCDDSDACTAGETCADKSCLGGVAVVCYDANPCTDDSCDPAAGCVFTPNALGCDDKDPCTEGELCAGGTCTGGIAVVCDDANPCTSDSCLAAIGCVHEPLVGTPCEDGDPCTVGDNCKQGGACGTGEPKDCDDGNPCTIDVCMPMTGTCSRKLFAEGVPCDDGNDCTVGDTCKFWGDCSGVGKACDDGNPCTDNRCDAATQECHYEPNSLPCDDGDACTVGDRCKMGTCAPKALLDCDDGNPCTVDSCEPATGCVHADAAGTCDDKNACTEADHCVMGTCKGKAADCDDGVQCTADTCDPATGCVHAWTSGLPCDDGDPCTYPDTCKVKGTVYVCIGATRPEACNGQDDDCDGETDEEGASGCKPYFVDADGDGFGAIGSERCLCGPSGANAAVQGGDCDDADAKVFPFKPKLPGGRVCGKDGNCDGSLVDPGEECDDGNAEDLDGCTGCKHTVSSVDPGDSGNQDCPSVVALPAGGFVIGWTGTYQGATKTLGGGMARRFSGDGTPVGEVVHMFDVGGGPSLAPLPGGGFVVAWEKLVYSGSSYVVDVMGQRFHPDGSKAGEPFPLNDDPDGDEWGPRAAGLPSGGFVAAWGEDSRARWRRFDPDGNKVGPEVVETSTKISVGGASVTAQDSGKVVLAWMSRWDSYTDFMWFGVGGDDSGSNGPRARFFHPDGTADGSMIEVKWSVAGHRPPPQVAALASGGIAVAWRRGDYGYGRVDSGVFDAGGAPVGPTFVVGDSDLPGWKSPGLAPLPSGGFVEAWFGVGVPDINDYLPFLEARRFLADGTPDGETIQVWPTVEPVNINDLEPCIEIAALSSGGFVIVWDWSVQAKGKNRVFFQRFDAAGNKVY